MNINRSLFSIPVFTKLRALLAKKLFSTAMATISMALLMWGAPTFARYCRAVTSAPQAGDVSAGEEPVTDLAPRGLSRQRRDFDRALDLLAGAAVSDNGLAQYFERVQKRVKGEITAPEKGSGVRAIKPQKRGPAAASTGSRADTSGGAGVARGAAGSLVEKVKGFIAAKMVADGQPSDAEKAAKSTARDEERGVARLTVGDMVYETNPAIDKWVSYYTTTAVGRRTMEIGINRSDAYLSMARAEFRRAGVPEDLVWLAFVESVWHAEAMSPAAAGGIWQFIPKTATEYGLTVSEAYDERMDPM
ncbi:MAG TPA: transglycosylase SLT domain-containing protein, partial [Blastocatellia bacterium]|nr:transglycosylase SLT domain-containing protein [Blastocatellia bacterium]